MILDGPVIRGSGQRANARASVSMRPGDSTVNTARQREAVARMDPAERLCGTSVREIDAIQSAMRSRVWQRLGLVV